MNYMWSKAWLQKIKPYLRYYFHSSTNLCKNNLIVNIGNTKFVHSLALFKINLKYFSTPQLKLIVLKSTSANTDLSCWNCEYNKEINSSFCSKCKMILPLNRNFNYFEILRIEKSYTISKSYLASNFRKLQSIFHPDKFSNKTEREQIIAAEHSSILNKAFDVLSHPVARAEYLLKLFGHSIEEGELTVDSDFLSIIMDINERLADAENRDVISEIAAKNNKIMDMLKSEAGDAFANGDMSLARKVVVKMKYYNNIFEKVKECELKYGIVH